ncbi:FG-GAP and VCBS repeat-containing protein [Streptomyces sp. NPDC005438]|uniref:VCBS repeat-containing protein n=1 Tax=Streptomyces sp. NPDC005438 TaxID=3156880 RepID=UPI0033AD792A
MRNRAKVISSVGVTFAVAIAATLTTMAIDSGHSGEEPLPAAPTRASCKQAGGSGKKPAGDQAVKRRQREDFNQDGYNDLAIAAPEDERRLTVVYGSPKGLDPSTRQVVDTERIQPGMGMRWGSRLMAGDFDGDGVTDLAVQEAMAMGDLYILWGARGQGLSEKRATSVRGATYSVAGDFNGDGQQDLFLTRMNLDRDSTLLVGPISRGGEATRKQRVSVVDTHEETRDLAAGDINGDGADDLFVSRGQDESRARATLLCGGPKGLTRVRWKGPKAGPATLGDFDGDGHDDLAYRDYSAPLKEGPKADPGTVGVIYGDRRGLSDRTATFTRDSPGVPGTRERNDVFGASLSAGDVDGDGRDDLAVGAPGGTVQGAKRAGSTVLLHGSGRGLTGKGAQAFDQTSPGIADTPEAGDFFGGSVRLLDFNGDGRADLADSAPGEDHDQGAVWAFPGGRSGLQVSRGVRLGADLGSSRRPAAFGRGLQGTSGTGVNALQATPHAQRDRFTDW